MTDLFSVFGPALRLLDPEQAHTVTLKGLKSGIGPALFAQRGGDPNSLSSSVFGLHFPNPVGLAAGFDKNAEVPDAMLSLGFGFVESGTVTPRPQSGNPRPRIFRLAQDKAVINRLGFNNAGLDPFLRRMLRRKERPGIVGANLGANKDSTDRPQDYVAGLQTLLGHVSYFTINISSPNTPGLRGLQDKAELEDLIARIEGARDEIESEGPQTPMLLKIAPDVTDQELEDIVEIVGASKIDGMIISNTTIGGREGLASHFRGESGGLSGAPLFELSTERLFRAYKLSAGKIPLVGVGGISSGRDAFEKIKAGASLVQLYSALIYEGPALVQKIKRDLANLLDQEGFQSVADAIGAVHK